MPKYPWVSGMCMHWVQMDCDAHINSDFKGLSHVPAYRLYKSTKFQSWYVHVTLFHLFNAGRPWWSCWRLFRSRGWVPTGSPCDRVGGAGLGRVQALAASLTLTTPGGAARTPPPPSPPDQLLLKSLVEGVIRILRGQGPQWPVGGGWWEDRVAPGGQDAALELCPDLLASPIRSGSHYLLPPPDRLLLQLSDVLSQGPEVYGLVTDVFTQDLLDPGERGDGGARGPLVPLVLGRAADHWLVLAESQILSGGAASHKWSWPTTLGCPRLCLWAELCLRGPGLVGVNPRYDRRLPLSARVAGGKPLQSPRVQTVLLEARRMRRSV